LRTGWPEPPRVHCRCPAARTAGYRRCQCCQRHARDKPCQWPRASDSCHRRSDDNRFHLRLPGGAPGNSSADPAQTATPPGMLARGRRKNEGSGGEESCRKDRLQVYTEASRRGPDFKARAPGPSSLRSPPFDLSYGGRAIASVKAGTPSALLARRSDNGAKAALGQHGHRRRPFLVGAGALGAASAVDGRDHAANGWLTAVSGRLEACGVMHLPVDSKQPA
jgi:hypothetical protein